MMKTAYIIKKKKGGKLDEKARLELVTILANAGYVVGIEKIESKSEYQVIIYEEGGARQ